MPGFIRLRYCKWFMEHEAYHFHTRTGHHRALPPLRIIGMSWRKLCEVVQLLINATLDGNKSMTLQKLIVFKANDRPTSVWPFFWWWLFLVKQCIINCNFTDNIANEEITQMNYWANKRILYISEFRLSSCDTPQNLMETEFLLFSVFFENKILARQQVQLSSGVVVICLVPMPWLQLRSWFSSTCSRHSSIWRSHSQVQLSHSVLSSSTPLHRVRSRSLHPVSTLSSLHRNPLYSVPVRASSFLASLVTSV